MRDGKPSSASNYLNFSVYWELRFPAQVPTKYFVDQTILNIHDGINNTIVYLIIISLLRILFNPLVYNIAFVRYSWKWEQRSDNVPSCCCYMPSNRFTYEPCLPVKFRQ